MPDVAQQRLRHLLGRENLIGDPRRDRAARHAVELCAFQILDQRHAASRLDLSEAVGAVVSGSGEDDADRPFLAVLRQGLEEDVDRVAVAARLGRYGEAQRAVANRQRPVGDDRMDAVGLGGHAVRSFHHRHGRVAAEQLRQSALAGRIQVQNDHEGAPAIGGHRIEKAARRFQSARRRTDADHRDHGVLRVTRTLRRRPPLVSLHDACESAQPLLGATFWAAVERQVTPRGAMFENEAMSRPSPI